jgi:hypothetical protein
LDLQLESIPLFLYEKICIALTVLLNSSYIPFKVTGRNHRGFIVILLYVLKVIIHCFTWVQPEVLSTEVCIGKLMSECSQSRSVQAGNVDERFWHTCVYT